MGAVVAVATALLCAGAAIVSAASHAADLRRGPVPELAAGYARATVDLTVTGDPRRVEPRGPGARHSSGAVVIPATVNRLVHEGRDTAGLRTPVLLVVRPQDTGVPHSRASVRAGWLRVLPSTRVRLEVRAEPVDASGTRGRPVAAVLRARGAGPPEVVQRPSAAQRWAGTLRSGLRAATARLDPDARALLPGLVIGDTSRVDAELEDAFRTTGMLHLLAVSGGNLAVLLVLLIGRPGTASRAERGGLAPGLGLPLRGTAALGALLTLAFVLVCRPDPSVLRAAACGLITLLAIGTGRRRSLLPALAAAVLLLVLYDPWLARDFGFLLSVLATGALLTLAPRWAAALRRCGVPGRLAEALAAAAAAQAVCAPVVAVLSAHLSLIAVPCNLLAEFVVAPATVLGFAALATAPWAMPLAQGLAWLASWPATAIGALARAGAALPHATLDWPGTWVGALALAALLAALVLLARGLPRHPWLSALCAALVLVALLRPVPLTRVLSGWPPPAWRLVVCDVGQGDALALAAGDGTAVLVDAGPTPDAIDRCLRSLGVTVVPLLLLTHFHADHVGGLPGVLRGRKVGAIQTTTVEEGTGGQAEFVRRAARRAQVPQLHAAPGERRRTGALTWQVLWPEDERRGTARRPEGANNSSVTLLVRTAGLTVFLPGDLEPPAQRALLEAHPDLPPVDVLKVAHHGSAFQDPALLDRLSPRIALISCGEHNSYGHPSPRTLHALRARGALVRRTDTEGALAVTAEGITTSGRASTGAERATRGAGEMTDGLAGPAGRGSPGQTRQPLAGRPVGRRTPRTPGSLSPAGAGRRPVCGRWAGGRKGPHGRCGELSVGRGMLVGDGSDP